MHWRHLATLLCLLLAAVALSCSPRAKREVVVYTAVDQIFSEPFLKEFERETGIVVKPRFDIEAAKTTGLVNALIAEQDRPRADVFWNNEIAQTLTLQERGLLQPYVSPNAADIPATYKDPDGYWAAFGGRARVFIINTDLLAPEDYPTSLWDLLDERYPAASIGIAKPLFGTTATHAAALYATWGPEETLGFFTALQQRGVRFVDGNSVVRDMVQDGQLAFGLTDTDDALISLEKGKPVALVFPDQGPGDVGTLVIPNTVAMVRGGPNPDEARVFIDYLLRPESERRLVEMGWCQVAIRPVGAASPLELEGLKTMDVTFQAVLNMLGRMLEELRPVFVN
jgi:iron(III) transport system substrate-binding protein